MFRGRKLKVNPPASDKANFGKTTIPHVSESLTASYRSSDWRDSLRLTFFRLPGEPASDTPFLPGLVAEGAQHSLDKK